VEDLRDADLRSNAKLHHCGISDLKNVCISNEMTCRRAGTVVAMNGAVLLR
jgi:hypothetical protein